jgi:hypothetical protein
MWMDAVPISERTHFFSLSLSLLRNTVGIHEGEKELERTVVSIFWKNIASVDFWGNWGKKENLNTARRRISSHIRCNCWLLNLSAYGCWMPVFLVILYTYSITMLIIDPSLMYSKSNYNSKLRIDVKYLVQDISFLKFAICGWNLVYCE